MLTGTRHWIALTAVAAFAFTTAADAGAGHHEMKSKSDNIVATADAAGTFKTLLAAAGAAGLADTLASDGPFTVFAPTDEAFDALPKGTVASLLKPENKAQLQAVLKFHVLAGKVGSEALGDGVSVDTLNGAAVTFSATEGGFAIENATILTTDIDASNGIIHVIDRVILPPQTMSQRVGPDQIIRMAIDTGVPLFNHGNAKATASVYRIAALSILMNPDDIAVSGATRARLQAGLDRAASEHDARAQAWTLRYALDDAMSSLMTPATQAMAAR